MTEAKREPHARSLQEWKTHFSGEGDRATFDWVTALRTEVEPMEDWKRIKADALHELESIPEDVIPTLLKRFEPFVEVLPAGHSKGHVNRDFIASVLILQDPSFDELDDVEKLVGLMAGTFHDVGSAVVNRYEEAKHFAGHAEVGAYMFDQVAADLLPVNLRKLCAFAIAAHTHYTKDITVIKKGENGEETIVKKTYDDKLEGDNKMGVWLARWSDRLDMQGLQGFVRHSLTKAQPTEDYSIEGFHTVREDEKEDFKHHFTPRLRSVELRKSLPKADQTMDTLEHIKMFRDTALNKSPYSEHDTPYFTQELVTPAALEQMQFVEAVLAEAPELPEDKINEAFDLFYRVCRVIEPGSNIDETIDLFKQKFQLLSAGDRSHWANGFLILLPLYDRWYKRIERGLSQGEKGEGREVNKIFAQALTVAREKLTDFEPRKILEI
jgi:hypothetical protein